MEAEIANTYKLGPGEVLGQGRKEFGKALMACHKVFSHLAFIIDLCTVFAGSQNRER